MKLNISAFCLVGFLVLFAASNTAMASESANQLARQVVDKLMNIENAKAAATIQKLERYFPDYPLLGFYEDYPLMGGSRSDV